jgi:hypothetical protein
MMKRAGDLFARGSSGPPVEDAQSAIAGRARAVSKMINRLEIGDPCDQGQSDAFFSESSFVLFARSGRSSPVFFWQWLDPDF